MIINMAGGGGGIGTRVKAYATLNALLADAPLENTIGIVTDSMTDYVISPKQPTAAEGRAWIRLGTDGLIDIPVDRKGLLHIYPLVGYLRSGSSWLEKQVRVYQNGAWGSTWYVFMQNKVQVSNFTLSGSGASIDSNGIVLKNTASSGAYATAYKQMDITNYSRLVVTAYSSVTSAYGTLTAKCGIATANNNVDAFIKSADMKPSSAGTNTYTVDISGNVGTVYVEVLVRGNSSTSNVRQVQVQDWRLEP